MNPCNFIHFKTGLHTLWIGGVEILECHIPHHSIDPHLSTCEHNSQSPNCCLVDLKQMSEQIKFYMRRMTLDLNEAYSRIMRCTRHLFKIRGYTKGYKNVCICPFGHNISVRDFIVITVVVFSILSEKRTYLYDERIY